MKTGKLVNFILDDDIKKELARVAKESGLPMTSIIITGINEQVAAHDRRRRETERRERWGKFCWFCDGELSTPGANCTNEHCQLAQYERERDEQAAINRAEFAAASGL